MAWTGLSLDLLQTPFWLFATAIYILPGALLAWRLIPAGPGRLAAAPVMACSLMIASAFALRTLTIPVAGWSTWATCILWTVALVPRAWWVRILDRPSWRAFAATVARARPPWLLVLALVFVAAAQYSTHLPAGTDHVASAWPDLLAGATGATAKSGTPAPLHVDEYDHMVKSAQIIRTGDLMDGGVVPYGPEVTSPWRAVHQSGFHITIAQWATMSGAPLPFLFRFLPALWSVAIAGSVHGVLRGGPGAIPAAAAVGLLPTTNLILGPGFAVPIAFGLAWTVAAWHIAERVPIRRGAFILLGLVVVAFLVHPVAGFSSWLAASLALALRPDDRASLYGGLAALVLGFLAFAASATFVAPRLLEHGGLPWSPETLTLLGWPIILLAAGGAIVAVLDRGRSGGPRAAILVTTLAMGGIIGLLALIDVNNLALYYRTQHTFFLGQAILAGIALGWTGMRLAQMRALHARGAKAGLAVLGVIAFMALAAPAVQNHLDMPRYHIFDEASWEAGYTARDAGMGEEDVFLSEPWKAPFYHAITGATPHSYFRPALQPHNSDEYYNYLATDGATEGALERRSITWVIDPLAPNATAIHHSPWVHELLWPDPEP